MLPTLIDLLLPKSLNAKGYDTLRRLGLFICHRCGRTYRHFPVPPDADGKPRRLTMMACQGCASVVMYVAEAQETRDVTAAERIEVERDYPELAAAIKAAHDRYCDRFVER